MYFWLFYFGQTLNIDKMPCSSHYSVIEFFYITNLFFFSLVNSEVEKIVGFCKAVEIPEKLLGLLKDVLDKSNIKQVCLLSCLLYIELIF